MAVIGNSFDLDRAIENQNYAYKCWFNYEKDGNTMRISDADMKKVLEQWSGSKTKWEAKAEQDITEYSIEGDYEWNSAYDDGMNDAKAEATKDTVKENGKTKKGWDGDTKKSKDINTATGTVTTVGAVAGAAVTAVSMGISSMTTTIAGCSNVPLGFVIAAPLEMAIGILYEATRPNKKENEALKNLKTFMETGQANLQAASLQMEQSNIEMTNLSAASENDKNKTKEDIAAKQELIKVAQATYNAIVARVKSGEPLSSTDKTKLNACKGQISALQAEIDALQLASIEFSTANSEAIASKKAEFDTHAQNIAKEKGTTDYAASFDEATKDAAKVQIAAHSINFAASILTTVQAAMFVSPFTLFALAFVGMAAAGAGMSAHAIVEQSMILSDTNKELDVRENTQATIEETTVDYENKLSNMVAQQEFVDLGIAELSEFEQEEIQLANILTETSTKEEKKSNSESSTNPFNDDKQVMKKNNNPFA